jgi:undecaprenyl diphosphate synthase
MSKGNEVGHLAIIPDGNRRWAKLHGLEPIRGHEKGIERMGEVIRWCRDEGIKTVSLWAFSTENFNRDLEEVQGLFLAFETRLARIMQEAEFDRHNVRVRFIGDKTRFPKKIQKGIEEVEKNTSKNSEYELNFFIGYGGRAEIVDMTKKIAVDFANNPEDITQDEIEKRLWSHEVSDPDLIIRTSGEVRLSGFMPFKSDYSELYFEQKLWPDFEREDLIRALDDFHKRKRRWGK